MSKKWVPVDPAELRPGDKFKAVRVDEDLRERVTGSVINVDEYFIIDSTGGEWTTSIFQWFRRKPAKPKRPAEPPVGTVVKNVSTGEVGVRISNELFPWSIIRSGGVRAWDSWDDWIAPGDEIEIAEWVKP